jgi:hypothetical protein
MLMFAAADPAPATAPPPPAAKPQVICREGEQELGSHMHASRRCMTLEQWQQEDARRQQIPISARITGDPDDAARAATRPH